MREHDHVDGQDVIVRRCEQSDGVILHWYHATAIPSDIDRELFHDVSIYNGMIWSQYTTAHDIVVT